MEGSCAEAARPDHTDVDALTRGSTDLRMLHLDHHSGPRRDLINAELPKAAHRLTKTRAIDRRKNELDRSTGSDSSAAGAIEHSAWRAQLAGRSRQAERERAQGWEALGWRPDMSGGRPARHLLRRWAGSSRG